MMKRECEHDTHIKRILSGIARSFLQNAIPAWRHWKRNLYNKKWLAQR